MNESERSLLDLALDADATSGEREAVDELLRRSHEARETLDDLQALYGLLSEGAAASFSDGFAERVLFNLPPARDRRPQERTNRRRSRLLGTVAIATTLAVAIALLLIVPVEESARRGTQRIVKLPDGSVAELNSGTTIAYRRIWPADRVVQLTGEAFFDVVEDERPFVVETFNARIEVVGTKFNVRARPDDLTPSTSVNVAEGRVLVERFDVPAQSRVLLEAGESSSISADAIDSARRDSVRLIRATIWRTGGLAFVDEPLATILPEVERRFDVEIALEGDTLLPRRLTYLNPGPQNASGVLADICHTVGLRYRRTAAGFVVFADPKTR